MITLFPKAEAQPEELPTDPALARLAFLARHLNDLQTICLAGLPIALMELPLLDQLPHHAQAITMAVTAVLSVAWYYLSRDWFRGRYGRSWTANDQWDNSNGWTPGNTIGFVTFGVLLVWLILLASAPPTKVSTFIGTWPVGIGGWLGRIAGDRTNLPLRRAVYRGCGVAMILSVLPTLFSVLSTRARSVQLYSVFVIGTICFSLALFDLWLLNRTFAQVKAEGEETS